MKTYIHDPALFKNHYKCQVGHGIPGFKGSQYGSGFGTLLGGLMRRALPLLRSGLQIAAPHMKTAAKHIAQEGMMAAMPIALQHLASNKKGKRKRKPVISTRKRKRATPQDVLN